MSTSSTALPTPGSAPPLHGLLAEFDNVHSLIEAANGVRRAGYRRWDAHTPFPVHGLDDAMGLPPTKLPWAILLCGLTGTGCALLMQWWMNAVDYPFRISGKPYFSLPAFIPVMFELTVLFAAFAAIFGTLALGKLPELYNPLFTNARFRRVTNDRFFIYVESRDPGFDQAELEAIFTAAHATAIETLLHDDRVFNHLPKGFVGATAVAVVLSLVPLALIARARETTSELPRIHVLPDDMDSQYKFKPQTANWFFSDGRAMRQPPESTVPREDMTNDSTFYTGKAAGAAGGWSRDFPPELPIDETTMAWGQRRYNVYCTPCHGYAGAGDGMVAKHAEALAEGTWIAPSSLHEERVRQQPVGEIFNSLTYGIRSMPAYGHLITEKDRWAIILYVRALERSQHAPKQDVPADVLPTLP
jgi:mono/diheme cytochrome c family protein